MRLAIREIHTRTLLIVGFIISGLLMGCGEVQRVEEDPSAGEVEEQTSDQPSIRQAPPRTTPRPQSGSVDERVQDAKVEAQIVLALADDAQLRQYPFVIEVRGGHVFIEGDVESRADFERVSTLVRNVDGVLGVNNQIAAPDAPPPDTLLADASVEDEESEETEVATSTDEEAAASSEEEAYHTVKSGESLWTIARQYQTSVNAIQRLNNISSNNLRPGQRLRVR